VDQNHAQAKLVPAIEVELVLCNQRKCIFRVKHAPSSYLLAFVAIERIVSDFVSFED
jgi:hypothetical protein